MSLNATITNALVIAPAAIPQAPTTALVPPAPAPQCIEMVQVATFTFDHLADASKVYVNTPKGYRAKLMVAECTIRTEIEIAETLSNAIRSVGIELSVERSWMPADEAWA
ncbi:hypothetical protein ACFONL_01670 [Camelimonas fluminis]|uniref:Uncharacterized protein n=1 Tax=Camelimonas fluminis TaxID=1576911 RepID=A0ABV7UBS6_9HYPH